MRWIRITVWNGGDEGNVPNKVEKINDIPVLFIDTSQINRNSHEWNEGEW